MTWAELFRRAWLVLRLRFKRFHSCEACGDVMRDIGSQLGRGYETWKCDSCEEFRELERARNQEALSRAFMSDHSVEDHAIYLRQQAAMRAAMQNAYIPGYGVVESDVQKALNHPIGAPIPYRGGDLFGISSALGGIFGKLS